MRAALAAALAMLSCATPEGASQGQGGARFGGDQATSVAVPAEVLFGVCWPLDAAPESRVRLFTGPSGRYAFEGRDGADTSTGRCLKEIASLYPWVKPPGEITVAPPTKPPSGWVVLAWARLLATGLYGPERGLTDAAPLVHACTRLPPGLRPFTRFDVAEPGRVRVGGGALTDAERCVEAVLGASVLPSSRPMAFNFGDEAAPVPAAPPADVAVYKAPEASSAEVLDATRVKESMTLAGPAVAACWNEALARRAGLGGARTLRFQVEAGQVRHAWVASTMGLGQVTAADYRLDGCLAAAVHTTRFPGQSGEGLYTWIFAARE